MAVAAEWKICDFGEKGEFVVGSNEAANDCTINLQRGKKLHPLYLSNGFVKTLRRFQNTPLEMFSARWTLDPSDLIRWDRH